MKNEQGVYTLITGASTGIGAALAAECAGRGQNLLMLALPGEALAQKTELLQKKYGVKTAFLEIDLTAQEAPEQVLQWVEEKGYVVNTLINNAGIGDTGRFGGSNYSKMQQMVLVNVSALVLLTRLFLPMLRHQPQAYILNVASMAAFQPVPMKAVYAGTKSFVLNFSQALRMELEETSVSVTVVCPGAVNTSAAVRRRTADFGIWGRVSMLPPKQVAQTVIKGMLNREDMIVPGTFNKFLYWMKKTLPQKVQTLWLKRQLKKGAEPLPAKDATGATAPPSQRAKHKKAV